MSVHWIPLESNPDLLTDFGRKIGLLEGYSFADVFGLDEELLAFVPKPVLAVLLLFPHSEPGIREFATKQVKDIEENGQTVSDDVFFMRQFVGNACGSIGVIHALGNNRDQPNLLAEGFVTRFIEGNGEASPEERGKELGRQADVQNASDNAAATGATETPEATANTDNHFICFVHRDGALYELDGGKPFPINHGNTTAESFLSDTAKVVKEKFMSLAPENPNFSLCALTKTPSE